jgi:hypothetical protein
MMQQATVNMTVNVDAAFLKGQLTHSAVKTFKEFLETQARNNKFVDKSRLIDEVAQKVLESKFLARQWLTRLSGWSGLRLSSAQSCYRHSPHPRRKSA